MLARKLALIVLGAALLAASPLPSEAAGPLSIGVGGGLSIPSGDAGDALERGRHGQAFLSLGVPGVPVGVRGSVGYERFDWKETGEGPAPDGHVSILSGRVGALLYFAPGRIRPYVLGGIGTYRVSSEVSADGTDTSRSETRFGIDAGAGLEMNLVLVRAFVETRLENIFTDGGFDGTGDGSVRIVPVTIGVAL
jgi:opacity protein-like surface antigen